MIREGNHVAYIRNNEIFEGVIRISKRGKLWVERKNRKRHRVSTDNIYSSREEANEALKKRLKQVNKKKSNL